VPDIVRLLDGIEVTPHLLDAASRWPDDVIVFLEVLYKEKFGCCRIYLVPAVGHRLPAAGLIERVTYINPESLQKLQSGYADLREQHIDVAGYEETNSHVLR
jgi:hypothetical protein